MAAPSIFSAITTGPRQLIPNTGATEFAPATISAVTSYNYNTKIVTFQLEKSINLELGQHIKLIGGSGMPVIRPYTPLNITGTHKSLEFIIKLYKDGRMSRFLNKSPVGYSVKFKTTRNKFYLPPNIKKIGMIAGGTGIAPIYQVIQHVLHQKSDIQLQLLFSNVVEEDILLREKLDQLKTEHETFKVNYTLTNPQGTWNGLQGRIDPEKIKQCLPSPSDQTLVLVCGPIAMTNALNLLLHDMGYLEHMIFLFL